MSEFLRMDRRLGDGAGPIKTQSMNSSCSAPSGQGAGAGLRGADQLSDVSKSSESADRASALEKILHALLDCADVSYPGR